MANSASRSHASDEHRSQISPTASSPRAKQWASTMAGYRPSDEQLSGDFASDASSSDVSFPEIQLAHQDSSASISAVAPRDRRAREEIEKLTLAEGATFSAGAGNREREEEPDSERTCFERDRDRILHSSAFRRLAGKTQVFVFPDDHQRTRLTHALEVAQVATAIARAIGVNVALTEAIALGHDCGHGPGGHASEDAFSPYIDGGYDHAVWGADTVLKGLNLCIETTDGIRNHSWSRPAPLTPEGEVVSWADRIAYVCHDFEDAVRAGIVTPDQLPEIVRSRCGSRHSRQLNSFIDAVVNTVRATGRIGMDESSGEALTAFRRFNYENVYMRAESVAQSDSVIRVLQALVEHHAANPTTALNHVASDGSYVSESALEPNSPAAFVEAVTYIGNMTDQYAFDQATRILSWPRTELPVGISGTIS
ncbi:MAG TPA: HD domain-containing protein [Microthrixaceae bacterium]|nr:HD domain-containing protein [Microthrixaceae bacterium]